DTYFLPCRYAGTDYETYLVKSITTRFGYFVGLGYYLVNSFWQSNTFVYGDRHYYFTNYCRIFSGEKLRHCCGIYYYSYHFFSRVARSTLPKYQSGFLCKIGRHYDR